MRSILFVSIRLHVFLLGIAILIGSAVAQSPAPATFKTRFYSALTGTRTTITVDLNNDGTPDLVTVSPAALIAVQLSDGAGHFAPKMDWAINHSLNGIVRMASGDLNEDGNADVLLSDSRNEVIIFFGDGHGGYCRGCPGITSTFVVGDVQVADFNHDGHLDIATGGGDAAGRAVIGVFYGNGKGQFTEPAMVYTSPGRDTVSRMVVGDFDGDTNADLAYIGQVTCNQASACTSPLTVLYGDGKGGFSPTPTRSFNFVMSIGTYDVNRDGHSDIVFTAGCTVQCASGIGVAYGLSNRTFDIKQTPTPGFSPDPDYPVAEDFNGNGFLDLAVAATTDDSNTTGGILIAQADAPYGSWKAQTFHALGFQTSPNRPVLGDWNRDLRPDFLTVEGGTQPPTGPAEIAEFLTTSLGTILASCAYPSKPTGINVCTPGDGVTVGPLVHFTAGVNSFTLVRKLELWLDGVKIREAYKTWMDFYTNVGAGAHQAVFFSAGYDNGLQAKIVNFTVNPSNFCPVPSSPGLNVCTPISGLTTGSPVQVLARGNITGTIARMEVWVDGVKEFSTFGSSTLQTSFPLPVGTHRFGFFVVNTARSVRNKVVFSAIR